MRLDLCRPGDADEVALGVGEVADHQASRRPSLTSTVHEFQAAQPDEPEPDEAAQQEITECDGKLRRLAAANDLRSRGRRRAASIDLTCRATM
jgi:hypothetical protein